jgi:putative membrane protein
MIATALLIADSSFNHHMDDWGAGWWILMALMMVAFWGLVIVGIVWLVRTLIAERHGPRGANPIELLDRRLASGEISPEEYRERRAVLRGEPGGGTAPEGAERAD